MRIKLQHFRNLVSLSAADGKIEETEQATLTKIANEQGISQDRLELMLKYANQYAYVIPQNQVKRKKQLKEMIDLALVDGEFAREEYELIRMVAEKLGFSSQESDQIIEARCGLSGNG